MCDVRNVKVLTEHLVVEFTEDRKIISCFVVPNFEDFGVDSVSHASANIAKCASTTRSITSSVAFRFH